jgi:hypothetical protein
VVRHPGDDFVVGQQRVDLGVRDRRSRHALRHRLDEGGVAKPLSLQAQVGLGIERSRLRPDQAEFFGDSKDLAARGRAHHRHRLLGRPRSGLTAGVDVWIAVGDRDVRKARPPIAARQAPVGLEPLEVVYEFEER